MINLIPIGKVISLIAVAYAVICCLILWAVYDENMDFHLLYQLQQEVLYFSMPFCCHFLLWLALAMENFTYIKRSALPDLNGTWDMVIHWEWEIKRYITSKCND